MTMFVTLAITTYMLFDPAKWLVDFMELTYMDTSFKFFVLILGLGNFALAYVGEKYVLPILAKWIGIAKIKLNPKKRKKRKAYKEILDSMRT